MMTSSRPWKADRWVAGMLLFVGILPWLISCSSSSPPSETPPGQAEAPATPPEEPELPLTQDTQGRTQRLLRLEQACDQWNAAMLHQEYARMESMESLLRSYTGEHFEAIISDLKHGSPRYRKVMAAALGFSEKQEAVAPLLESLKDQYYEVVLHALLSLYHLADPRHDGLSKSIDPLLLIPYLQHPKTEVRSNAAMALSRLVTSETPKSVLLALIATAEDKDPATRVHAVAAMGASRDHEAFPHLVKALSDTVELVRLRASLALGRLGDENAAPYLIQVLERPDEATDVKRAAARALGALLGQSEFTLDPAFWKEKAR